MPGWENWNFNSNISDDCFFERFRGCCLILHQICFGFLLLHILVALLSVQKWHTRSFLTFPTHHPVWFHTKTVFRHLTLLFCATFHLSWFWNLAHETESMIRINSIEQFRRNKLFISLSWWRYHWSWLSNWSFLWDRV